MKPVLTILMPVRDEERYLQEALDSLSAQSFGDWRCLVVDDGSRDGTQAILKDHGARDERFKIFTNEEAGGIVKGLNFLLSKADTPYAARMDGDDISTPDRLKKQLRHAAEEPGAAIISSLVGSVGEVSDGWSQYLAWVNGIITGEEILFHSLTESPLPHPTWLFRTQVVKEAGGYREGDFPEDYELFLRLLLQGSEFAKIPEVGLLWRDHPSRLTRLSKRCSGDSFLRLKASYFPSLYEKGCLPHLPKRPIAIRGAGKTGRILATELIGRGIKPALFVDPLKEGSELMGIPVVAPGKVKDPESYLTLAAIRFRDTREIVAREYEDKGMVFGRDYIWLY